MYVLPNTLIQEFAIIRLAPRGSFKFGNPEVPEFSKCQFNLLGMFQATHFEGVWGGPSFIWGATPTRLHQSDGVAQCLVQMLAIEPADGREERPAITRGI